MLKYLIDNYNKLSYTHNYILGFSYKKVVYFGFFTSEILPYVLTVDFASRGCGKCLKFKPTTAQKLLMLTDCQVLCSEQYFEQATAESKYNRGEMFEKMVTEYFGQEWKKDNVPFTVDGDLTVDGIAYQIKFNKASFINEKTLARLTH